MEWGAEAGRDYSGWLTVANRGEGASEVVHLSFGERSAGPEMQERAPEGRDPLAEGISATLESMRRQIEEAPARWRARHLQKGQSRSWRRTRRWSTRTRCGGNRTLRTSGVGDSRKFSSLAYEDGSSFPGHRLSPTGVYRSMVNSEEHRRTTRGGKGRLD